jgi:hypothetical protein
MNLASRHAARQPRTPEADAARRHVDRAHCFSQHYWLLVLVERRSTSMVQGGGAPKGYASQNVRRTPEVLQNAS